MTKINSMEKLRQFYVENIPKLFEEAVKKSGTRFKLAYVFYPINGDYGASETYIAFPRMGQIVLEYTQPPCPWLRSDRPEVRDVLSVEDFLREKPTEVLEITYKSLVGLVEGDQDEKNRLSRISTINT